MSGAVLEVVALGKRKTIYEETALLLRRLQQNETPDADER